MSRSASLGAIGAVLLVVAGTAFAAPPCPGDCNQDGVVLIDEVVHTIDLSLRGGSTRACPLADADADGTIAVAEVVGGVRSALLGCPDLSRTYAGTISLDSGRRALVEISVGTDGQATGDVLIQDDATTAAGSVAALASFSIGGAVDLDQGTYSLSGSFVDDFGTTHTVSVSGKLPLWPGVGGHVAFHYDSDSYNGWLSLGSAPPPQPSPTPTATPSGPVHVVKVGAANLPFDPEFLEIDPGDTVMWMWIGGTHSVQSGAPGFPPPCTATGLFDSGPKTAGTFSFTFTTPGRYPYQCGVSGHCAAFEGGVIEVRGTPSPTPTPILSSTPTATTTPTPATAVGVTIDMFGTYDGRAYTQFNTDFPIRMQIWHDLQQVYVTDISGEILGIGSMLTMTVLSPTKIQFSMPDPLNFRELTLEYAGAGHVTGTLVGGSMGMGMYTVRLDLTDRL